MIAVIVPGRAKAATSWSWSVGRIWPEAITSWTSVTTTGMTVKGMARAGDLADHADLDHLRLDLAEAGDEAGDVAVGDEDAGGAEHRVDDVAGAERELLDDAVGAGDDQRLVERDLGLGAAPPRRWPSGRQREVDLRLDGGLAGDGGVDGALGGVDGDLGAVDLALGDGAGVAAHQLGADVVLVLGLLERAAGLDDPALGLGELRPRRRASSASTSAIRRVAVSMRRLLLGGVEAEERLARR